MTVVMIVVTTVVMTVVMVCRGTGACAVQSDLPH